MKPQLWPDLVWADGVPAYSTLLAIGFILAGILALREARRQNIDHNEIIDLIIWMVVFGVGGARLLHVIADGYFQDYVSMCFDPSAVPAVDPPVDSCSSDAQCGDYFVCAEDKQICHPPKDCLVALKIWRGGLAYYGGFLAAALFCVRFVYHRKMPFWRTLDLFAPYVALGLFFGRMGCYLNGCCFGKVCRLTWGLIFPKGGAVWRHQLDLALIDKHEQALPVYPTQLYQAILNLATFAVLYFWFRSRKRFDGEVLCWLLILKGFTRSIVEIFRDDDRGVFFGELISTSQLISIPLFILAIVMYKKLRDRRYEQLPA